MATFRKVKNGHKAEICIKLDSGEVHRKSKTFETKLAAQKWAIAYELAIRERDQGIDTSRTVGDLLKRYSEEVSTKKRTGRNEQVRLTRLQKDPIAQIKLADIKAKDFAYWRDQRLKTVSPASVLREMNILHHAFEVARKEWEWITENPITDVNRPSSPPPRDRRISDKEIAMMLMALGFYEETTPHTKSQYVAIAFLFAIETAMRAGEICSLTEASIKGKVAYLPMTKNGTSRQVPLSTRALELLALLPETDGNLFRLNTEQLSSLFRKARMKTTIEDLVFHDTRHEAISRLASRLNVLDLARMVGHRDIRMLQVYYNATAEELASKLD